MDGEKSLRNTKRVTAADEEREKIGRKGDRQSEEEAAAMGTAAVGAA